MNATLTFPFKPEPFTAYSEFEFYPFKPEPFTAYSEFEFYQLEEELNDFGDEEPLATAWQRARAEGGLYAIYKNKKLQYIGKAKKLGGPSDESRLYKYWWYAKSLGCNIRGYKVRVKYVPTEAERNRLEAALLRSEHLPGNIRELEAIASEWI